MDPKKILIGLGVGWVLLIGVNSAMASMWDQHCQRTIEKLQGLQQEITKKKQEIDNARVAEVVPSNFIADGFERVSVSHGRDQAFRQLENLFQNTRLILSELSSSCLSKNEVSR